MKHDPRGITTAMQLYFSGESLRNVSKSLKLIGMDVTHQTVYNWIKKYTELMGKYIEKITPQVGDAWRADEIFVKIKGDLKYVFALMDDETRYLIAHEVARYNITVNAIAPGYFSVGMFNDFSHKIKQKIAEEIPAKRLGQPDEISELIGILISSSYLTGQTFIIDGGYSC